MKYTKKKAKEFQELFNEKEIKESLIGSKTQGMISCGRLHIEDFDDYYNKILSLKRAKEKLKEKTEKLEKELMVLKEITGTQNRIIKEFKFDPVGILVQPKLGDKLKDLKLEKKNIEKLIEESKHLGDFYEKLKSHSDKHIPKLSLERSPKKYNNTIFMNQITTHHAKGIVIMSDDENKESVHIGSSQNGTYSNSPPVKKHNLKRIRDVAFNMFIDCDPTQEPQDFACQVTPLQHRGIDVGVDCAFVYMDEGQGSDSNDEDSEEEEESDEEQEQPPVVDREAEAREDDLKRKQRLENYQSEELEEENIGISVFERKQIRERLEAERQSTLEREESIISDGETISITGEENRMKMKRRAIRIINLEERIDQRFRDHITEITTQNNQLREEKEILFKEVDKLKLYHDESKFDYEQMKKLENELSILKLNQLEERERFQKRLNERTERVRKLEDENEKQRQLLLAADDLAIMNEEISECNENYRAQIIDLKIQVNKRRTQDSGSGYYFPRVLI